jgi:hypothetical protein
LIDGSPATTPYTFYNIVADGHTISVTFELTPTPVIPELPSCVFMVLVMVPLLVGVILYRKRNLSQN